MYISAVDFDSLAAFISGFDLATGGSALQGFREWLLVKVGGYAANLAWTELVLEYTFRGSQSARDNLCECGGQQKGMNSIITLLDEFWRDRSAPDGMRRLYKSHEEWLRKQSWYSPSAPNWIGD